MPTHEEAPGQKTEGNSSNNFEGLNLDSHDTGPQRLDSVYARGAPIYREAGWSGVLPLTPRGKKPVVSGFHGYDGGWPTDDQIAQWSCRWPDYNLGLRVGHGILTLDVDAYDDKTGGDTLAEAERLWGPLPPTYRSSSRYDDPISGQRPYRVPVGILFRPKIEFADLGIGHIDIIQPHLRVMAAWPSVHLGTGQVYRWYAPDNTILTEGVVPGEVDVPELPAQWLEGLARDALHEEVFDGSAPNRDPALRQQVNEDLYQQLIGLQDVQAAPDRLVEARLDSAVADLTSGTGSRYDCTRDHVAALMRMQASGRVGVPHALDQLRRAYVLEVGDTRPAQVAEAEFLRFTQGAAMLIAATPLVGLRHDTGQPGDSEEGAVLDAPTWGLTDLTDVLTGNTSGVTPTLLRRTDGLGLLYPGMTHSFHGESESGKSLILQAESVRLVGHGQRVLYVDFESDEQSIVDRLLQLGAEEQAVADHFNYLRPEVSPTSSAAERAAWESILDTGYALVVIDGVTEALTVFGRSSLDNDDLAAWSREVPRKIADRTGAAVVLIDHVVKDKARQNRYAIGGQAKMASLTGAAYTVEVGEPLGLGMRGVVDLRVGKDRPGQVRDNCGPYRKGDRTQLAARIVIDSTTETTMMTVEPWDALTQESTGSGFRPTSLMQRISRILQGAPEAMGKTETVNAAGGKKQAAMQAFDLLVVEGYLEIQGQRGRARLYRSVRPYSQTDDPLLNQHSGGEPDRPTESVPTTVLGSGS